MPGGDKVADRSTERMNRDLASTYKSGETKRQRGRPKGALNKPKSLIPKEMALAILDKMQPIMEKDDFEYHKSVILHGKKVSVEKELDILILLLSRQMVPAIMAETEGEQLPEGVEDPNPSEIKMPEFRKDVTERIKVLKDLISLKMQNERNKDDSANNRGNPIAQIFLNRQLAGDRLRVAIEHVTGPVGGSVDESERQADSAREVPVAVSQRPISLPGTGEGKTDRNVANNLLGDGSRGMHKVEVRG